MRESCQENNVSVYPQDQNNTQDKNLIRTKPEVNFRGISNRARRDSGRSGEILTEAEKPARPSGDVRPHEIQLDDSSYQGEKAFGRPSSGETDKGD